jgi:flagellar protein FlgJ
MDVSDKISSYNDFQGMAELRAKAQRDQGGALDEVATQFEGMFLNMMLKEMRKTVPESELFNSSALRMFTDMQDQQMALAMAKQGPLGFADMLKQNLAGQLPSGESEIQFEAALQHLQQSARAFQLNSATQAFELPKAGSAEMALDAYQSIDKGW